MNSQLISSSTVPATPSWKSRLACLFYEALVVLAIVIIGLIIPHALIGVAAGIVAGSRVLLAHLFLMLLFYFAWQWLHGGQTLAMKTWKIRLVSADGGPLRPAQALLRFAVAWPGTLLFGAGFLWAFLDPDGQYLHDRIAGSRLESVPAASAQD
jgi:uncharacterized RDD family membrane protein YckC